MINSYQIILISDSTGETLDRIFLALKAQFKDFNYQTNYFSFTRTENQIKRILEKIKKGKKIIILYTIVDTKLSDLLIKESEKRGIPCFGVLDNLIQSFSKILNQNALHVPSGQHIMNDHYYRKIDAIQFTMNHDDGNLLEDIQKSDIILLGVSRTSKTPTAIYLANKGYKVSNIPIVNKNSIPEDVKKNPKKKCIIGLIAEPKRLAEIRRNRMNSLNDIGNKKYIDIQKIQSEVEISKKTFQKFKWPTIDVSRKSVEETAASVIKIYEINKRNV